MERVLQLDFQTKPDLIAIIKALSADRNDDDKMLKNLLKVRRGSRCLATHESKDLLNEVIHLLDNTFLGLAYEDLIRAAYETHRYHDKCGLTMLVHYALTFDNHREFGLTLADYKDSKDDPRLSKEILSNVFRILKVAGYIKTTTTKNREKPEQVIGPSKKFKGFDVQTMVNLFDREIEEQRLFEEWE